MLCQRCNQREACVHVSTNVNGVKKEAYLCKECAQKENEIPAFGFSNLFDFDIGGFLSGMMPHGLSVGSTQPICKSCGMDLGEFKQRGRFGCPDCYRAFRSALGPLLTQIHGAQRHTGKLPKSAAAPLKEQRREDDLRQKLNEAIRAERFEEAAKLRDELKDLEAQKKPKKEGE